MSEQDTPPSSGAATAPRAKVGRRSTWIRGGGLAVSVVTVLAGVAQIMGLSVKDFAAGKPAAPAVSRPAGVTMLSDPASPVTPSDDRTTPAETAPVADRPSTTRPTAVLAQARFGFAIPAELPLCSDVGGDGERPASGRVLIFVRHAGQSQYFYEQPVEYPAAGQWVSRQVRLGDESDDGQFYLYAVRVAQAQADAIVARCQGRPCAYDGGPPGTVLATSNPVTRTASAGSC